MFFAVELFALYPSVLILTLEPCEDTFFLLHCFKKMLALDLVLICTFWLCLSSYCLPDLEN
jgi:hypothetical protein